MGKLRLDHHYYKRLKMDQEDLIRLRIDDLESKGFYDEKFRLKLTAKHALVIGKWQMDGDWGVDLRRWSFDKSRLLGQGITLKSKTWEKLYEIIYQLNKRDAFNKYGNANQTIYKHSIRVDEEFRVGTEIFSKGPEPYFCVNLIRNDQLVWIAKGTCVGIIIRFNTITDFINKSQSYGLVPKMRLPRTKGNIDSTTGREVF